MSYLVDECQKEALFALRFDDYLKSPFHAYLKDKNGKFLECNANQAKSFGCNSEKDVIGQTDRDFIPLTEAKLIHQTEQQIIQMQDCRVLMENASFQKNSSQAYLSIKLPMRNSLGKVIGIYGTSILFNNKNELASNIPALLVPSTFSQLLSNNGNAAIKTDNFNITPRERECLHYLSHGLSAKEIAKKLDLSPRTVEFYIDNMKKKLGCTKRTELIAKSFDLLKQLP